ncbi:hypothetical protein FHS18_002911 [Paenibacillus phyllosphaerae]|uniref:Paeninodin family lasso peptide n=1 Tax=Paenibacillus phyllosphaerae TaxID=274593 RepID=A0A7W5AYJ1_9BACL|nr:hypothetical protein [Paenibacillus phyllosphaerae]MBB3110844.1 hypothetical protein [Paenibacillus phyllosphaerae]
MENEKKSKKAWTPPTLEVLDIQLTQETPSIWQFIQTGDNSWKREFVLES